MVLAREIEDLSLNDDSPGHLFAAGQALSGSADVMTVFRSSNNGSTWTAHPVCAIAGSMGSAVAFESGNENVLYAGGAANNRGALFKSVNGGSAWVEIAAGLFSDYEYVRTIVVDPAQSARVFVGTSRGIYRSQDGGAGWTKVHTADVNQLRLNRAAPGEIYAATSTGVHSSGDGGATWGPLNEGLVSLNVRCLDWLPAQQLMYAGTLDGSIFQRSALDRVTLTVSSGDGGTTNPAPGSYAYAPGTRVDVWALPDDHCEFAGWTGQATGTANPLSLTLNGNVTIRAEFERILYAPLNAAGVKKVRRSLLLAEYIAVLTWAAHPDNAGVDRYRIYKLSDGGRVLAGVAEPSEFEFRMPGLGRDETATFEILAVDAARREGRAAVVTVR